MSISIPIPFVLCGTVCTTVYFPVNVNSSITMLPLLATTIVASISFSICKYAMREVEAKGRERMEESEKQRQSDKVEENSICRCL